MAPRTEPRAAPPAGPICIDRRNMVAFLPAAVLAAAGAARASEGGASDGAATPPDCTAFKPDPACWAGDVRLARLWRCGQSDCPGYVYNPLAGEWTQDIPPGTAFEDLPADFWCPACGAEKSAFVLERDLSA